MCKNTASSVKITVTPRFLEADSKVGGYFWEYCLKIINDSNKIIQVLTKYINVVDENGGRHYFSSRGVLGDCILLNPNEEIEYSSGIPLFAPSGIASGRYVMASEIGESFEVGIPPFSLDSPFENRIVH